MAAGDAFFEPADVEIAHFDNASAAEPAAFIAFYPPGAAQSAPVEMPRPG